VIGLGKRWQWPPYLSNGLQVTGWIVVVFGLLLSTWAMLANKFFSAVVRVQLDRDHYVVDTGPYRIVRHPGYAGALLSSIALPLALDSIWAEIPTLIFVVVYVLRTYLEDKTLIDELDGYCEYSVVTRYRLFPGIW
ncbi:MAG: isoprenylcysteine carboxylmethyltransferase family protein, partial [Chloroflexota bacterium]